MALATVVKTIRDFTTGLQIPLLFGLFGDGSGGTVSLHGTVDSNGTPIDPMSDETGQAIHTVLLAMIVKQTPPTS